jgi:hypothetical protein
MKTKLPPHGSALNEFDVELVPPVQRPCPVAEQSPTSFGEVALPILRGFLWLACVGWTVLCLLWYMMKGAGEDSAIRDAATAANACVGIIAGYVICRAIDSATRS